MSIASVRSRRWMSVLSLIASALFHQACARESAASSLVPPPTASAGSEQTDRGYSMNGKRIALVIGNAAYPHAPLKNPRNDAEAMADKLASLNFEVIRVLDGDLASMTNAVHEFQQKLSVSRSLGLFYFSGHGVQLEGVNYLIPVDAKVEFEKMVEVEAVSVDFVLTSMSAARSGVNVVFLDACRNNPFVHNAKAPGRGLAPIDAPDGTLIGYATRPNKTASDGDGDNGVYTGVLVSHLADPGLTIEQVHEETQAEVARMTQRAQVPTISSDLAEKIYLNPNRAATAQELVDLAEQNRLSGDFLSVVDDLSKLLAEQGADLSVQLRAQAERLLAEAKAQIASLRLDIEPRSAMFRVDTSRSLSVAGLLTLNPGRHELQISERGYVTQTRTLTLEAGASTVLPVRLEHERQKWVARAFTGAAVASLATWAVTGLRSRALAQELKDKCGADKRCPDGLYDWRSAASRGPRLARAADATLGIGIASLLAGGLVYYWPAWFEKTHEHVTADLHCHTGGCVANGELRF
jgi:uncharacterized caspase-like protein